MKKTNPSIEHELNQIIAEIAADYAVGLLDGQGRILYVSRSLQEIYGCGDKALLGKSYAILFPENDRVKIEEAVAQALRKGRYELEDWHQRRDGTSFWAQMVLIRRTGKKNTAPTLILIIRDLNERHKAEEATQQRAYFDELTGLANQTLFNIRLRENFGRAREHQQLLALFYLDLDRFNKV